MFGLNHLMNWKILVLIGVTVFSGCVTPYEPAVQIERANVLPLALNDQFQFRKQQTFFNNPRDYPPILADNPMRFQRFRMNHGALTALDIDEKTGNFLTFFWRAGERADVTVRLEYRQAGLGNFVLAKERYYPEAKGSYMSEFQITGDEYLEAGRVLSWRVLLIVDNQIVAFRQSFMWK